MFETYTTEGHKTVYEKAKLHLKKYSDPGHGWLAVKRSLLEKLNILTKISAFSYQNGATVYLEEDCDIRPLYEALLANNISFTIETKYQEKTPIRNYQSFTVGG